MYGNTVNTSIGIRLDIWGETTCHGPLHSRQWRKVLTAKRMMTYFHDPRNLKFVFSFLALIIHFTIHVHQSLSINHLYSHLKFVFMPKMDTHRSKWALRPFGKPHLCHGRPSWWGIQWDRASDRQQFLEVRMIRDDDAAKFNKDHSRNHSRIRILSLINQLVECNKSWRQYRYFPRFCFECFDVKSLLQQVLQVVTSTPGTHWKVTLEGAENGTENGESIPMSRLEKTESWWNLESWKSDDHRFPLKKNTFKNIQSGPVGG